MKIVGEFLTDFIYNDFKLKQSSYYTFYIDFYTSKHHLIKNSFWFHETLLRNPEKHSYKLYA